MTDDNIQNPWEKIGKEMNARSLAQSFCSNLFYTLGKDRYTTTKHDNYMALALAIRDRIVERWVKTQQNFHKQNVKRVYYLSLEFLIGRLLGSNILNMGLDKAVRETMGEFGLNLADLREEEADAGLGNGGLGRLAACFLDSMATLQIPAHGYGIRYDYGIFTQKIVNGYQIEAPDEWRKMGNPWEVQGPESAVKVRCYGTVQTYHDARGKLRVEWANTQNVIAMPYDTPIVGYRNDFINTLRLWSARGSEEFDLDYFNSGDYEKAVYDKMFSENISRVLYPNDQNAVGKELRLKQEYFFTCASIADIIRRFKAENKDLSHLPDKVSIQLNDTHPALAVAELMRVLVDEEEMEWVDAWAVTTKTFSYTNHTVMPEALECWPVQVFERLLPRHLQIIYEINAHFLREVSIRYPGDNDRLRRMSIIEEGEPKQVRMAYLAMAGSYAINGVSELHTKILKTRVFGDFFEYVPAHFHNKTNGISIRRWLLKSNSKLSELITSVVGAGWESKLNGLQKLENFKSDPAFQEKWRQVKRSNKERLVKYLQHSTGVPLNLDSLFDVQVKRIHEYKRQTLFAFYILSEYLKLKNNPNAPHVPRTFLVGGKSAPGYAMAKLVIKFINSIAEVVNQDRDVGDKMKVLFLENYRVSLAEKIFPASDLSEQISTAGMEASGTGCMKFMVNGALTVGTPDGANIEMAEEVGPENIFNFGLTVEDIQALSQKGYSPRSVIQGSPVLLEIFKLMQNNFFSPSEPGLFYPIIEELMTSDRYFVCADFEPFCAIQEKIAANYRDTKSWTEKAILNVARSGKFSSDRTIAEYARDIWHVTVQAEQVLNQSQPGAR